MHDLDLDIEASDAYAILAGVLLFDLGVTMAGTAGPTWLFAVSSMYVFGTSLVLVCAGVLDIDMARWGRPLAAGALLAIAAVLLVTWVFVAPAVPETDVMAFLGEATSLTLEGTNPYTVSLATGGQYPTPQLDGTTVSRYSYPAGGIVATVPSYLLGIRDWGRLTTLFATFGVAGLLIRDAPGQHALLALVVVLVDDFLVWGLAGLTDAMWVFPLLIAYRHLPESRLATERPIASAVAFGIATTMKQTPWFAAPFVLVWMLRTRGRRAGMQYVTVAISTFGLINAPFTLTAPQAWLTGALTPLFGNGSAPVHAGIGLSSLTKAGVYALPKSFHTSLVVVATLGGLGWYWRRFDRVRWIGWFAWAPLLLLHYRSFPTYLTSGIVVAVFAFFGRRGGR